MIHLHPEYNICFSISLSSHVKREHNSIMCVVIIGTYMIPGGPNPVIVQRGING